MRGAVDGRRVAVTGVGVAAACGIGAQAFWAGLLATPADEQVRRVPDFDPLVWFGKVEARHTDRFAQLAVAAAELALDDGGRPAPADPDLAGVVIATGIGGGGTLEQQILVRVARGEQRVSPYMIPMVMPNSGAATVSMRLGWRGPCETIATACAAGTHALAAAGLLIASGRCEFVLAGGAESALTLTTVAALANMTALTPTGISRPFDADRDGFAAAEGAGVLLLEPLEAALARGARVYCVIEGSASNADAYHITAPAPRGAGAAACMRRALDDAGLRPADIVQVNAHGTSTPLNDAAEAIAITDVFGLPGPAVTSVKGVTGHALGAAGAVEAVAVALSMHHRLIPPTAGHVKGEPDLSIDVVTEPRPWEPGPTLSNSFGFGGHNGCLVFVPA